MEGYTISYILEGENSGVKTVGIIEVSSELAPTKEEYNNLTQDEKLSKIEEVTQKYK